ncbi:MAG: RIBULOSE-phosphate 3-epimerase, partial [Chaenotheca gracillima]
MFRNPRENASSTQEAASKPSTGRPPTPPDTPRSGAKAPSIQQPPKMKGSKTPLATKPSSSLNGTGPGMRTTPPSGNGKVKGKSNGSILSFFKKVDIESERANGVVDDSTSLFVGGEDWSAPTQSHARSPSPTNDFGFEDANGASMNGGNSRYNEDSTPVKRRKFDNPDSSPGQSSQRTEPSTADHLTSKTTDQLDLVDQIQVGNPGDMKKTSPADKACSPPPPEVVAGNDKDPSIGTANLIRKRSGPFVEDSDSEDEPSDFTKASSNEETPGANSIPISEPPDTKASRSAQKDGPNEDGGDSKSPPVTLKREPSSVFNVADFEDFKDWGDGEYMEGEEFLERRYMEEQRRLEMAEDGLEDDIIEEANGEEVKYETELELAEAATCPVCNASFAGVQDSQAQVHVNNCLDGNPTPLVQTDVKADVEQKGPLSSGRFQRPARPAKPGQANPFAGTSSGSSSSAFSRLMSSHAEDQAWATAAAAENSARGKPAYQRTCPFYKILPGFSICVDAFRYGAVEGCRAYFLSHFHSDHYVGLTSTWQHGPIYCSRVTANLVRQQLRVDPKYVVDLEFEQKIEVPGTGGVEVTMIPANHCPGSSLYLFEKQALPKGSKNPRLQRVLHCGDFRACPAHLQHPLLRPDQLDAITGKKTGQQKIDVCYLDTTYLNPRYAFPSQENVIKACADMCVSLKKDRTDENDDWERTKRERAGSGMTNFVRRTSSNAEGHEPADGEEAGEANSKSRGRLLVVVGTYSIGKERICVGIAKALQSKIYAPTGKQRICVCLEDEELNSLLTTNPSEAQVHMTPLFEIRAETLQEYLNGHKPHFSRVVGFRPSGWTYRPPNSRFIESPSIPTVLHSNNWRSAYSMAELVPQRGSTREASCFGVPYSEHSSFRELTMFCCALRIDKVIPTVNVGSAKGRERMKGWIEKWAAERKKNGLFVLGEDGK